jgi:hypothetical protein
VTDSEDLDPDAAAYRLEMAARILSLLYALISIVWLMWILIPEHQRKLWAMRAAARIRQVTGTLAFRTGHQAMGLEIASNVENYRLPYLLSAARDKAAALYEKLRYTA